MATELARLTYQAYARAMEINGAEVDSWELLPYAEQCAFGAAADFVANRGWEAVDGPESVPAPQPRVADEADDRPAFVEPYDVIVVDGPNA